MEKLTRRRNVSVLVAVLFAQVLGLAVQVKRSGQSEETRLIRLWTVSAVTPFEKVLVWAQRSISGTWRNYLYLRGVRAENRELKQQIEEMRIERVRLSQDAEQARRLQRLLSFKEKFIVKTVAAQVIGSSGSEQSRSIYIDKGSADGVKADQPVITADGVVGKVIDVEQDHTAKVLLVNDETSGVGVVLEKSRLQGILRGTPSGELVVEKISNDEPVEPGERVLTSGGDQIFPKGLNVGAISKATPGADSFLNIRLTAGANLGKLEEVLIVTEVDTRLASPPEAGGRLRAADILAERLPSVPPKPGVDFHQGTGTGTGGTSGNVTAKNRPSGTGEPRTPAAPNRVLREAPTSAGNSSQVVATKPRTDAGLKEAPRNPSGGAMDGTVKRPAKASPSANAAQPVQAPTDNTKPSLTSKPASGTSDPAAQPANKSTIPGKSPPGPVSQEDNPQ